MDITTAELTLAQWVAQQGGLTPDESVFRGELPAGIPGVRVVFLSGRTGSSELSDFVAEVHGLFAEPEEARSFADAVWGVLPRYNDSGFTELSTEGAIAFGCRDGWFTATGRIRALFA